MFTHNSYETRTFFIKKDSTLPKLKYGLTHHVMQKYDITSDMLDNCAVTFSMTDENGFFRIANMEAKLVINNDQQEFPDETTYTLSYQFKLHDTRKAGRFEGEFVVDFLGDNCGKIKFPVDTQIPIIISDTTTKTDVL